MQSTDRASRLTPTRIAFSTPLSPHPSGESAHPHTPVANSLWYLMLWGETRRGLPYSLWALPDQSELPDCLVWLARHWGTQVYRSLSLKFGRYITFVRCTDPPRAADLHLSARARLHSPLCAPVTAPMTIPTPQALVPTTHIAWESLFEELPY